MLHVSKLATGACLAQTCQGKAQTVVLLAMPAVLSRPLRRLRDKTWLGFELLDEEPAWHKRICFRLETDADEPLVPVQQSYLQEESLQPECSQASKQVYLVTLPALRRLSDVDSKPGLQCPSTWDHETVARVLLDAFQRPVCSNNNAAWGHAVQLEAFVVFREHHAPRDGEARGPAHWHIALKASSCFRFAAFKRALSVHHGIASHWSCSHTGYWSAVRYGYLPSPTKPQDALDPSPFTWARDGCHRKLFEVCQEPTTANALSRRRETKVKAAYEEGKPEPRPSEIDLYAIIVRHGFRNTDDDHTAAERLIQWLKQYGSPGLVSFAFKNRQKLPGIIDDVWSWENVDDFLQVNALTRKQRLQQALTEPCQCGGMWLQCAVQLLQRNHIHIPDICSHLQRSLFLGRREDVPVVVLMGRFGGEGKSFLLSPLRTLFGVENVQATPQPGSFPLLGLERRKAVLLDEWAFDTSVLALPTQLLWYEGKPFPLTRPQNKDFNGHLLYQGTAPIFVTCKEKELAPIISKAHEAAQLGKPSEWTMLLRRLRLFTFTVPFPVSTCKIPECATCFARLLNSYAVPMN